MRKPTRIPVFPTLGALLFGLVAVPWGLATDLIINLPGTKILAHKTVHYRCDHGGAKIGLPSGAFEVEYINGSGNNLAAIPIFESRLIFSNISSASGARYAAQRYIWWEAGGIATLYYDSLSGKQTAVCRPDPLR
jgi:membrane-bound inhibitor of C-type lysozyme